MCKEHLMVEKGPIMQIAMVEMWELLTVEQKKKVADNENGYDNKIDGNKNQ